MYWCTYTKHSVGISVLLAEFEVLSLLLCHTRSRKGWVVGKVEGGWGGKRIAQESPQSHGHIVLFSHASQVHVFSLFLSLSMPATLDTARNPLVVQCIAVIA